MKVHVLYFNGCPNHEATLRLVRKAAQELGLAVNIEDVEVTGAEDAERLHFLGSPSVHVNGVDIERSARSSAAYAFACRTYNGHGIPPRELVVAALKEADTGRTAGRCTKSRVRSAFAFVPSVAAFLLPLGKCPACWPTYAALLSSFGLGFLFYDRYLLPLATLAAMGSLLTLAYGAPSRRGYGPFSLALVGSLMAAMGKFVLFSWPVLWLGLILFVLAAGWNAWPKRQISCATCAPQEGGSDNNAAHVVRTT